MNTPLLTLSLLLASGLMACHKQTVPAQADMDAESRQKAIEVRATADKKAEAKNQTGLDPAKAAEPPATAQPK